MRGWRAWLLAVASAFWLLVSPPWGAPAPVEAPTSMGARR
jgi:hypothetical protein